MPDVSRQRALQGLRVLFRIQGCPFCSSTRTGGKVRLKGREVPLQISSVFTEHAAHNPPNIKAYWMVNYSATCWKCETTHPWVTLWMSLS